MSVLECLPCCATCGVQLVLRDGYDPAMQGNGHTYEQRYCGIWYDHPPTRECTQKQTVLYPSPRVARGGERS